MVLIQGKNNPKGSGWGVVDSVTRGPRFESSHQQTLFLITFIDSCLKK